MSRPAETYRSARRNLAKKHRLAWRALPRVLQRRDTETIIVALPPPEDLRRAA